MNRNYSQMYNGYLGSIQRGVTAIRRFSTGGFTTGAGPREENLARLKREIETADAIVIGAGAGLSTAAGFTYSGERFERWFSDFRRAYGFHDMYSGGFCPYPKQEIFWAYWARYIYVNRYLDPPKPVYQDLFELVKDRNYFVITTNVDHCFQKAGFDKQRLFYTQGDYGLFQSTDRSIRKTFDNEVWVKTAMEAQGFVRGANGLFAPPTDGTLAMEIPTSLIPTCQEGGGPVTMNLRSDDSFVEDVGWRKASAAYGAFLRQHEEDHILFLEIGVGANTPIIIKYPFWAMTEGNPKAVYACLNFDEALCPRSIESQAILLDGDSGSVLRQLLR